jgi:hypothetical protein
VGEFVGQEPVAERRIITMGVDEGVGQVGVLEVAPADRAGQPAVVALGRETEHPAGQPHVEPLSGQVTDQRVGHFGSVEEAK